jgi:hypothetical protein
MRNPRTFRLISIGLILFVSACRGDDHVARFDTGDTDRIKAHLDLLLPLLVMTPKEGNQDDKNYRNSGAVIAQPVDASLSRYVRIVDISPLNYPALANMQPLLANHVYGYIVVPVMIQGENHS